MSTYTYNDTYIPSVVVSWSTLEVNMALYISYLHVHTYTYISK